MDTSSYTPPPAPPVAGPSGAPSGRRPAPVAGVRRARGATIVALAPYLFFTTLILATSFQIIAPQPARAQTAKAGDEQTAPRLNKHLPDLVSATSDEPIVAVVGQDAFISCVAKNLQNYTIIWRYTNDANAPADNANQQQPGEAQQDQPPTRSSAYNDELGAILTAGRQRVIADDRFSVIQSHETWLLKISNVRLADTGTYVCHTNSEPRVRALRILSVIKPGAGQTDASGEFLAFAKTRPIHTLTHTHQFS